MTDPETPDQVPPESPFEPPVPPPASPYQPQQQPAVPPPASPYPASASPSPYSLGPQKPPTILSLLALIFGIVGVAVSCCYGAGFLFSLAGVILGHLGLKRESARGMALTGVITGYVGLAMVLVWIIIAIGFFVFAVSTSS